MNKFNIALLFAAIVKADPEDGEQGGRCRTDDWSCGDKDANVLCCGIGLHGEVVGPEDSPNLNTKKALGNGIYCNNRIKPLPVNLSWGKDETTYN